MNTIFYSIAIISMFAFAILFFTTRPNIPEKKQIPIITYTILIWYVLILGIAIKNFDLLSTFFKSYI